ncbi:MAG TPA: hypothetical protein VF092_25255 [Longimicrobium sp.]
MRRGQSPQPACPPKPGAITFTRIPAVGLLNDLHRPLLRLLDERTSFGEVRSAAQALYARLADAAGLDAGAADPRREGTGTSAGRAISPVEAARCVLDFWRTAAFLRGVLAALEAARGRFRETLEVVYAGTGPFATLLLPLLPSLAPRGLRVTLIDLHGRSTESVRRLVAAVGVESTVAAVVTADAARYRHGRAIHVVIAETMQRALENEPQVAVSRNLAAQLAPGGILVPERVSVHLGTWSIGQPRAGRERQVELLRLRSSVGRAPPRILGGGRMVTVPRPRGNEGLALLTRVRVFGCHRLDVNDSAITLPREVPALLVHAGRPVHARYAVGTRPGFTFAPMSEGGTSPWAGHDGRPVCIG